MLTISSQAVKKNINIKTNNELANTKREVKSGLSESRFQESQQIPEPMIHSHFLAHKQRPSRVLKDELCIKKQGRLHHLVSSSLNPQATLVCVDDGVEARSYPAAISA